jgi:hypothetical protein
MRKRAKKLVLSRETLRHLQPPDLRQLWGGTSGTCPTDCDSAADCGTTTCGTAGCGGSAGCPITYTCPPTSYITDCPVCG